jgi:hypothetical protein
MLSLVKEAKQGLLVPLGEIIRVLQWPPMCPSASYRQKEGRLDLAKVAEKKMSFKRIRSIRRIHSLKDNLQYP